MKRLGMPKRLVVIVDEEGKVAHQHANLLSLTYDSVDDLEAALAKVRTAA